MLRVSLYRVTFKTKKDKQAYLRTFLEQIKSIDDPNSTTAVIDLLLHSNSVFTDSDQTKFLHDFLELAVDALEKFTLKFEQKFGIIGAILSYFITATGRFPLFSQHLSLYQNIFPLLSSLIEIPYSEDVLGILTNIMINVGEISMLFPLLDDFIRRTPNILSIQHHVKFSFLTAYFRSSCPSKSSHFEPAYSYLVSMPGEFDNDDFNGCFILIR